MVRYRLRTLLILFALAPAVIAAAWYQLGFGEFSAYRSDAVIRSRLLRHTPRGTKAEDVLKFVLMDRQRSQYVQTYWNYFFHERPTRANEQLSFPHQRTIETIVGSRPVHLLMEEDVKAIWHFDDEDRLIDVTIDRFCIGP